MHPIQGLLATGLAMLAIAGVAVAVSPAVEPTYFAAVDRFVNAQMAKHRVPGLALAITRHGQVVHVRGYGAAREGEPVTAQTQFRLASLSKSFTAVAVLQLAESGRVDLDALVSRYVTDFTVVAPPGSGTITVRQLLNHTSGLADAGFVHGLAGQQNTLAERVASLKTAQSIDRPGTAFHYFDPNYQVLARLVELVSGQPFDVYLKTNIFAPLGMANTVSAMTSDGAAQRASHLAQGHMVLYGVPIAVPELSGFLGGSGGIVSSAADMAHYLAAQSQGRKDVEPRMLSPAGITLMQTPPPGLASSYGMGWAASEVDGIRTVEHNGVLSTFYADAVLLPDTGYAFVLLYNEYALATSMVAFPAIKHGLVALLTGRVPAHDRLSMPVIGLLLAAVTAIAVGLAIRSLLQLRNWKARSAAVPLWKVVLHLVWLCAPGILLLALPPLLGLTTGRYFDHGMLSRAMPEIYVLLAICGALGAINGAARLVHSMWRRQELP